MEPLRTAGPDPNHGDQPDSRVHVAIAVRLPDRPGAVASRIGAVERSVTWYRDELGLEDVDLDAWRAGQALFPSVRLNEGTIIDLLQGERSGTNVDHFCLVVEPTELKHFGS